MFYRSLEQLGEIHKFIDVVYNSDRWSNGIFCKQFSNIARQILFQSGMIEVLPCVNGTVALQMALLYRRFAAVLVPELTAAPVWLAAKNAPMDSVAGVYFYGVEDDWEPDLLRIEEVLKLFAPRPVAVIVVHTGGLVCRRIEDVLHLCTEYGATLIEDISHAHCCRTVDRIVAGAYGDVVIGSMYATKVLNSGEGGFIGWRTPDDMYPIWNSGRDRDEKQVTLRATNGRPSEFQAALMLSALHYLPEAIAERKERAKILDRLISRKVRVPVRDSGDTSSYYKYIVMGDPEGIADLKGELAPTAMTGLVHDTYGVEKERDAPLSKRHICLDLFYPDLDEVANAVNLTLA